MAYNIYHHKSPKYKYVATYLIGGNPNKPAWVANIDNMYKRCTSEREAALTVDKYLIGKGRNPINILKKMAR